jgi:hypothetical protein
LVIVYGGATDTLSGAPRTIKPRARAARSTRLPMSSFASPVGLSGWNSTPHHMPMPRTSVMFGNWLRSARSLSAS